MTQNDVIRIILNAYHNGIVHEQVKSVFYSKSEAQYSTNYLALLKYCLEVLS